MKAISSALLSALVLLSTVACEEVKFTGTLMVNDGSGDAGGGSGGAGGGTGPGGSASVDPKKDGPGEVTPDERARCLRDSTKPLKVVVVDGVRKEVELSTSEALAIIIRGVGSEVDLTLSKAAAGNSIVLCVFARGARSEVGVNSSAKLDYLLYDARGGGNEMKIAIGGGGSLAGGKVNLYGGFNEFELEKNSDAGAVVCPQVDDRGFHNEVRCDDH